MTGQRDAPALRDLLQILVRLVVIVFHHLAQFPDPLVRTPALRELARLGCRQVIASDCFHELAVLTREFAVLHVRLRDRRSTLRRAGTLRMRRTRQRKSYAEQSRSG